MGFQQPGLAVLARHGRTDAAEQRALQAKNCCLQPILVSSGRA
jgi:hypothetical protein